MRLAYFAATFFVSGILVCAQTGANGGGNGRIVGTVLDERGRPLHRISVSVFQEQSSTYMPTTESDEYGKFVVDRLEPGTYDLFGQSEDAGYPNTSLSFYSRKEPTKVVLGDGGTATVVLVLGPIAGILTGTIIDKTTGTAAVLQHAPHFIVKKLSNPEDSIEFEGPGKFRWLIPPATDVSLQICAEGYKVWLYADPSNPSRALPLRMRSGEKKMLKVELEGENQGAASTGRLPCSDRTSEVR